jgi:diguanylate cyclase (GGDEF)-like protein/PAS domain S-box-containing protein
VSFRLKTIIGIAAIELVVLAILALASYVNFGGAAKEQFFERARNAARLLASSVTDAVLALDLATLNATSRRVLEDRDLVYISILDKDGRVLASAGDSGALDEAFKEDGSFDAALSDHRLDISAPITVAGEAFGKIQIGFGTRKVEAAIHRALVAIASLSFVGMILVTAFGSILGSMLTRQLTGLQDGISRLAAGNQGYQVPVSGEDELARTARCFNEMSGRLARKSAELAAREAEARQLAQVAEQANDAIAITDAERRIVWVNRAFGMLTGYSFEEAAGAPIDTLLLGPQTNAKTATEFREAFASIGSFHKELLCYSKNRATFWADASIAPIRSQDGALAQFIVVQRDVTDRKAAEAALLTINAAFRHQALHDPLTGLGNRRYLDGALEHAAARCANSGQTLALLHVDLDRFKQINDSLGHAAGDHVLVHVAQLLKSLTRGEDEIARVGGDEFIVACVTDGERKSLIDLASRFLKVLREPIPFSNHLCRSSASIGIAAASGAQIDPKALMVNADIALYRAKGSGRNRYEFFTEELQLELVNTKRMADDILRGLENQEFLPFYQPQFDAATLDIVGVEALTRWRHPKYGIMQPASFLRIAQDLHVIADIDRMLLDHALKDLKRWREMGLGIPKISMNLSSSRLRDPDLVASLRELSLPRGALAIEILESVFLDDVGHDEQIMRNILGMKELGIGIEIDDFGTGHASITSLIKLKPDRLKIDRQIIEPITRSERQKNLVKAIIEIGLSQDIAVTAEGVEDREQINLLRQMGCTILQGFYFARALSATELENFASGNVWRAVS